MKKVVLAGIFVLGSSLLEVHAMSGNHEGTYEENGNASTSMHLVQTEDNGELVVQPTQTVDAGELTVADLKVKEFREEFKTLMYNCISAVYGEQAKEDPKFKLLATVLDDKHKSQMRTLAMLAQSEKNRQRDTFDREMEAKNAELEEARNEKIRIEREKELQSQIGRVFIANPSLSREKIMIRSAEVNRMTDIFKKRDAVQKEYSKFESFSGLLGQEDLGVNAKQSDLTKISEYLNNTRISPKPAMPTLIKDVHNGPKSWNRYVSFSDMRFLMGKYGMLDVAWNYPGTDWGEVHTSWAYGPERENLRMFNYYKDKENSERKRVYNNELSKHNQEYERALRQVFPSEEFDRLVEQFNVFVSKIK